MSVEVDPALLRGEGGKSAQWLGTSDHPHAYRVIRKLGAGGMAEVLLAARADDAGPSRRVAIKLVRDDHVIYREFREMFAEEAKLASRLTHPNIVAVLDYACDADTKPFLVMEYVAGVDLSTALRHPRALPLEVAVFVAVEVLRGLGYAHSLPDSQEIRGVVHRDLSPQNILLSWDGAVKISDFGIARALVRSSVSGTLSGKPSYMSPEQTRGDRLDGRSDLYSTGVVLWEMLTGRRLFGRGRIQEIFAEIALGAVPPPSEFRPEVPPALDLIVGKMLAVDRDDRYRSAEDVLADLGALRELPIEGARALSEALAERFHRPPMGSDGISVMAEDRSTFDATGVTPTFRTETEDGTALLGKRAMSPSGSAEAHPDNSCTTTATSKTRRVQRRFDLVVGAAAALLLAISWLLPLVAYRTPLDSPSSGFSGHGEPAGRGAPPQALRAPFEVTSAASEAAAGYSSSTENPASRSPSSGRPHREVTPLRRRPTVSRDTSAESPSVKQSGIIDLRLEGSGS